MDAGLVDVAVVGLVGLGTGDDEFLDVQMSVGEEGEVSAVFLFEFHEDALVAAAQAVHDDGVDIDSH